MSTLTEMITPRVVPQLRQSWRGRAVRGPDGGKRLAEEEFGR